MRRLAIASWVWLLGCHDEPSAAPPPLAAPVVVAPMPPAPPMAASVPCAAIGLSHADAVSALARERNADALAHHAAGRYEASEAGFRAAMEASPDYRTARFNHACALARLGRDADAWAEIEPLLCTDLPSFAPRVRADADLESVRASHDVDARVSAIAAQYRALAAHGTPLVAYEHGPALGPDRDGFGSAWEEAQAIVWLHADSVALPMGPRQHVSALRSISGDAIALPATRYDPVTGNAFVVSARGNLSEGGGLFGPLDLRVVEGATGAPIVTTSHSVSDVFDVRAWLTGDAIVVRWVTNDEEVVSLRASAVAVQRVQLGAAPTSFVAIGNLSWEPSGPVRHPAPHAHFSIDGGPELELGTAPRWGDRFVVISREPAIVYVLTRRHGECGTHDRFLVERMSVASGERLELWAGEDAYPIVEEGADGALYIQAGEETRRFPDLGAVGSAAHEVLWPGFGLTSSASDVNPYC